MEMDINQDDDEKEDNAAQEVRTEIQEITEKAMKKFGEMITRKFNELEERIEDYHRLLITTKQQDDGKTDFTINDRMKEGEEATRRAYEEYMRILRLKLKKDKAKQKNVLKIVNTKDDDKDGDDDRDVNVDDDGDDDRDDDNDKNGDDDDDKNDEGDDGNVNVTTEKDCNNKRKDGKKKKKKKVYDRHTTVKQQQQQSKTHDANIEQRRSKRLKDRNRRGQQNCEQIRSERLKDRNRVLQIIINLKKKTKKEAIQ